MKAKLPTYDDAEQALREWTTAQRAAFALKQKIERQRWEIDVLAPAQQQIIGEIAEGLYPTLHLPEMKELLP